MDQRPPYDWKEVGRADFEEFLKSCNDYYRDAWANGVYYVFRWNKERFAFEWSSGAVMVDPQFLV